MATGIERLHQLSHTVFDLAAAAAVLSWDQQTYMPPGGASARAEQMATLSRLAHEHFVNDEFGGALERALVEIKELDPDSEPALVVRRLKRDFDKKRKVPAAWVEEYEQTVGQAFCAWKDARAASDFSAFLPHVKAIFGLRRAYSEFFAPYEHVYDPLLDDYEPGMKTADVAAIFDTLRPQQVVLVEAIVERGAEVDDDFLRKPYDAQKQWDFGLEVIRNLGYDFDRGRQDKAPHPFSIAFSLGDVRITNRIDPNRFGWTLFGSMHEAGHAMYSQGLAPSLARIPSLSGASMDPSHHPSLGLHESQSRMMENLVGRSRAFWAAYYPRLQEVFPTPLAQVGGEDFYRAINKVAPSLIRVEADEATYNLHVMLRFEIEIGLMEGLLDPADLPEAWNGKVQDYLGLTPPDDAKGVLQDVHWSNGYIGYFPTYTLGNLIACIWWEKIVEDIPNLQAQIESAQFADLLAWLREHIHQHGAKYDANELIARVTGGRLTAEPYLRYLKGKYEEIYRL